MQILPTLRRETGSAVSAGVMFDDVAAFRVGPTDYLTRGWSPLPLPAGAKYPPSPGTTGWAGRDLTASDIDRHDWSGNIALRVPADVVGVDVDVYNGGADGLAGLEERFGKLPPTTWSTSRDDGSGIALYRVPLGATLATDPAQGVDLVQHHHRYIVCAPSIHPEGRPYRWVDEGDEVDVRLPPHPGDLPDLPWSWIGGLTVDKEATAGVASAPDCAAFIAEHCENRCPAALRGVTTALGNAPAGGRHDRLVETSCWAMREAAAGHYPAQTAIDMLHDWWNRIMDDPRRRDGAEFGDAIAWAIAQAEADPERIARLRAERDTAAANGQRHELGPPPPNVDAATGEILGGQLHLPEEFWSARPELDQIRQAAHARGRSADAVLAAVLGRVATLTPPTVGLPPIVGGRGTLDTICAIVGPPGVGKSGAVDIARSILPTRRVDIVDGLVLGSGEGLVDAYLGAVEDIDDDGKKRRVRRQTMTAVLAVVDEGQVLVELGGRRGATLLPTLRSAWSGATLGQANASAETHRRLAAGFYRFCAVILLQPEHAATLLADGGGGLPQRIVWATATDPTIPDEQSPWPGPLDWTPPPTISGGPWDLDVHPDIAAEIRTADLARARGGQAADPLDSHGGLARLKIAGVLAILAGRTNITREDWALAGHVVNVSRAVRMWVTEIDRAAARRREGAAIARAIRRDVAIVDSAAQRSLDRAARAIANRVHKQGGGTRRDLRHAVAGRDREHVTVEAALEEAERLRWIVAGDDDTWTPGGARPT